MTRRAISPLLATSTQSNIWSTPPASRDSPGSERRSPVAHASRETSRMALVAVVLVVALLLGRALSGRVRRLAGLPIEGWPLLVLAALAQLGGGLAARAG